MPADVFEHPTPPPAPTDCEPLSPANPSAQTLTLLARRRSTPIAMLGGPGPDEIALREIIRIGARVPDHRRVEPWRFIVIDCLADGAALGDELARIRTAETEGEPAEADLTAARNTFQRAPAAVAVISSPNPAHKTPVWEQELSAGAACQNMLLAANAMGWAGVWLTEWCAFSQGTATLFGLTSTERFAGFLHFGTAKQTPPERPRPNLDAKITSLRMAK